MCKIVSLQIGRGLLIALLLAIESVSSVVAQDGAAKTDTRTHLLPPSPGRKALLVFGPEGEAAVAKKACLTYGIKQEFTAQIDLKKMDYRAYHTIVAGSNAMDVFGSAEGKRPEAFVPLEKFVRGGGHLIVMGVFNGRNTEHLKTFGVTCGTQHCLGFSPTPATPLFFQGCEHLMPKGNKLRSVGNFSVSRPHVSLMNRDDDPKRPVMITMDYEQGRFTFNLVEPSNEGEEWLITALLNWVSRGAPTPDFLPTSEKRLGVPSATDQKEAEALLRNAYKDDYARIAQASGKLAVAKQLFEQDYSAETNPAVQFVALNEVRTHAAAIGEVELAFQAIDQLAAHYQVDGSAARLETLNSVGKSVRDKTVLQATAKLALDTVGELIDEDQYSKVAAAIGTAKALAQKSQDKHQISLVPYYDKRSKALSKEFQKIAKHAEAAIKTPPDFAARAEYGKFLCFVKEDWNRGLPLLASSNDMTFQPLAERDMQNAKEGDILVALADDWWTASEPLATEQRAAIQRHAAKWYHKALPLLKGLVKTSIQKKLEKVPTGKAQLVFRVKKHHQLIEFEITHQVVQYRLLESGDPDGIMVNDFVWDYRKQNPLPNSGGTRLLAENVDLFGAKLTQTQGRGTVELHEIPDGIKIRVVDPPDAADDYEFRLVFGGKN